MTRRLVSILLAVIGGGLVVFGWTEATRRATVARVATDFLEAVRDGEAVRARQLLHDGESRIPPEVASAFGWQRDPATDVTVRGVTIDGEVATVETAVTRAGYRITPTLTLVRVEDGEWRVSAVQSLGVDRRWIDAYEDEQIPDEDRRLTESLRDRVKQHVGGDVTAPGVVERL